MVKERPVLGDIATTDMELPVITSRPIDVFVTPQMTAPSSAVNELIRSLERVNPSLAAYKQEQYITYTKEEEAKAEEEFNKTKKGIRKAVKDGTIPPGASPEYINKWVALDLKRKSRKFKSELFAPPSPLKAKTS